MNSSKTVFAQVMEWAHREQFQRCVERYQGEKQVRTFSCRNQFLCMAFGQLTYRDSLRDTVLCLESRPDQLYQMGFRGNIARSTLADANETRDWRIYADFAQKLITKAHKLYVNEPLGIDLEHAVYALDSTTINLCLSLCPWAQFRQKKGAIKLHTQLDLRGPIPSFIDITNGKTYDGHLLDVIDIEAGSFYIMDRGFTDFKRLYNFQKANANFVIRSKKNLNFIRHTSQLIEEGSSVKSDQIGRLGGLKAHEDYSEKLRRVHYLDAETSKHYFYLTNNFVQPATIIAKLYKMRWEIELFFKWIKQNLKIKTFYGTSQNAVKTQIWIAVCVYVIVAIIKKELNLSLSLHSILQILSINPYEKVPINQLLTKLDPKFNLNTNHNQLILNGF